MTSIEKLDLVLNIIARKVPRYMNIDEIIVEIHKSIDTEEYFKFVLFDLQMMIEKLIEDGYVKTIELKPTNLNTGKSDGLVIHYKPTFKGKFLSETGGYAGLDEQRLAENIRVEKIETYQLEQAATLNKLTGGILIVTAIAAVYYLIEVSKWIYSALHSH